MYTYTDPKVDIGVSLADEPFELDKLEEHFREHTKVTEVAHQMERIPLMERTTPTTEAMTLKEFKKQCKQVLQTMQNVWRGIMQTSSPIGRIRRGNRESIRHTTTHTSVTFWSR